MYHKHVRKIARILAVVASISMVVEPAMFATEASAVTVSISDTYNTATGVTNMSINASGTVTAFNIQGPAPTVTLNNGGWVESAPGCITLANQIQAGNPQGSVVCTNPSPPAACITVAGGAQACNSALPPSPITGIDANCQQVNVSTSTIVADTCSQYAQNPQCVKQGQTQISTNPTTYDVSYDCGTNQVVAGNGTPGGMSCPGKVDCTDGSCVTQTLQANNDFGKAAATMQAAQFMQGDGSCDTNGNCTVFKGKGELCKDWEFFGNTIKNCCAENVPTPDMSNYIKLVVNLSALNISLGALNNGTTPVYGAWQAIGSPGATTWNAVSSTASQAWDKITTSFTNSWESIAGPTNTGATAVGNQTASSFMSTATAALTTKIAQWSATTFGPTVTNMFFQQAETSTESSATAALAQGETVILNPAIMTAMSYVMIAYTVYQVTMILINLIFKCDQPQFEYLMHKKLKTVHSLGMYCAQYTCVMHAPFGGGCMVGYCSRYDEAGCNFNSPLARIIQEQARPQLGISWGTPAMPNCQGLTTKQLSTLDWSKIDLTEWINILKTSGNWPSAASININNLTGAGSTFDTGGRMNSKQRTLDRINGKNMDQLNNSLMQGMMP